MTFFPVQDGELAYAEDFLAPAEADFWLSCLLAELDFREESIVIAGRLVPVPRRVCWYGDPGASYRYSGVNHAPKPWTGALSALKEQVEAQCGQRFNSVLGNLYRDGMDAMGWHADKEKELGPNPFIASVSLGAERLFELRHTKSREMLRLPLGHGSLLLMGGALQHHWRHRIPRMPGVARPRVNLTFRAIVPAP